MTGDDQEDWPRLPAPGLFPELADDAHELSELASGSRPGRVALIATRRRILQWAPKWLRSAGLEVVVLSAEDEALTSTREYDAVLVEAGITTRRKSPLYEMLINADDEHLVDRLFVLCHRKRQVDQAKCFSRVEVIGAPHDWEVIARRLLRHIEHRRAVDSVHGYQSKLRELRGYADFARDRLAAGVNVEPVSGLPNRDAFHGIVERSMEAADNQLRVAVVVIGFSRFGLVVDALGETEARQLVREVGARLAACIADAGSHSNRLLASVIGNLGHTRFGAMLSWDGDDDEPLTQFRQRLMSVLEQPTAVGGRMMNLSACLGIAVYPEDAKGADQLLQRADDAMHEAEQRGGGFRYHALRVTTRASASKLQMEHDLHGAMQRDELVLNYQPIVRVSDNRIVAAEALLRWQKSDGIWVSPEEFVAIAEESGQIHRLGEWVIDRACADMNIWAAQSIEVPVVCLNVSRAQLITDHFVDYLAVALRGLNVSADHVELELSERGVLARSEDVQSRLELLKQYGVRLSVDDFGTGDSSIEYLRRLPIDVLKIDKSYTREIGAEGRTGRLMGAILAMANALLIDTIVEGVESYWELEQLRLLGCHAYQGFLHSHPMSASAISQLLRREQGTSFEVV